MVYGAFLTKTVLWAITNYRPIVYTLNKTFPYFSLDASCVHQVWE